ncbi:hypothetical protein Taro_016272 [Colocasia esculenta]|uniref:NAC domain-containing protein n=1 Tax=Colocasia esculenta TaxID=4460 RepID=A0A843UJT4_COLES|nr:hypothetical protein [Colocasia esculenta]
MAGSGQVAVPPGFRFHPTDEELLCYYLRKKVMYEAIDLDVIREIDLNKVEPWDLKDRCRIGSGPQNEWYLFSHKDKKYPTGTRTNRATNAGFWKATGRDKAIHHSYSKSVGMRKTLVFYTGRAPHGQKTDWIMHEYRLNEDDCETKEEGWVVCRVFKKKNHQHCLTSESAVPVEEENNHWKATAGSIMLEQRQPFQTPYDFSLISNSMHLPQLLSSEPAYMPLAASLNMANLECTQNLVKLGPGGGGLLQHDKVNGDGSTLDNLLASHQNLDQILQGKYCNVHAPSQAMEGPSLAQMFVPLQYLGLEVDMLKFTK